MRLFFDANTLFTAAHNPMGKAALVIEFGESGHWRLCTSTYAVEEARRNLEAKFPEALPGLAARLAHFATGPESRTHACPDGLPAKDCPIYLAAHGCGATHLLTGDLRDFGPLMNQPDKTDGLMIQAVAQFLNSL
jgi:hypothetical protein